MLESKTSLEWLSAVGGLGLFLLGMMILTEGLKGLAGRSLRRLLTRFTRNPASGAVTGAVVTALIQSSSATTVTAVGFVGAGLLTFAQALGIIFGANIGTTITGWLVAWIGFKLDLALAVLPLVLIGVLLRLFGRGRTRYLGWAVAGFSLLFLGIDAMQSGLAGLEDVLTAEDFPNDSLLGRLQLVGIGVAITLATQSSSAGIAAALVALGAGAISFPQAAAMVIGMDVGTTFTAALATIGGSTATRRTGFAHVIYNVLTGTVAFFSLGFYVELVAPWIGSGVRGDPQMALVAFHTCFNALGVLLVLPFTGAFARLIVWLVPGHGSASLQRLDDRLLSDADAALDAALQTLHDLAAAAVRLLVLRLQEPELGHQDLATVAQELAVTRSYLERVRTDPDQVDTHFRHRHALHTLDHSTRLVSRLADPPGGGAGRNDRQLRRFSSLLEETLSPTLTIDSETEARLERLHGLLQRRRPSFRKRTIRTAALGGSHTNPTTGHRTASDSKSDDLVGEAVLGRLDFFRWLLRVSHHTYRIVHHLRRGADAPDPGPSPPVK